MMNASFDEKQRDRSFLNTKWNEMFAELKEYIRQHGTVDVAAKINKQLYDWVSIQICIIKDHYAGKKTGTELDMIKAERIKLLESIGLSHELSNSPSSLYAKWDKNFEELKEYKQQTDRLDVPLNVNKQLNRWVRNQRLMIKDFNSRQFQQSEDTFDLQKAEKVQLLKSIGLDYEKILDSKSNQTSLDSKWNDMFEQLKAHKQKTGNVDVPVSANKQLYYWGYSQKCMIKDYEEGKLQSGSKLDVIKIERIKRLKSIGFGADISSIRAATWEEMFVQLKEYKQQHGTLRVSVNENKELHHWIRNQKQMIKDFGLGKFHSGKKFDCKRAERVKLLKSIGFEDWNEMFEELKKYKQSNGNLNVPLDINKQVHDWVHKQKLFVEGLSKLQPVKISVRKTERLKLLRSIGFEEYCDKLFTGLNDLEQNDGKLDEHANRNRSSGGEKNINSISSSVTNKWSEMFAELKKHKEKTESFKVLFHEDTKLYNWVRNQRYMIQKFETSKFQTGSAIDSTKAERVNSLRNIGFDKPEQQQTFHDSYRSDLDHVVKILGYDESKEDQTNMPNQKHMIHECCTSGKVWTIPKSIGLDGLDRCQDDETICPHADWAEFFEQLKLHKNKFDNFEIPSEVNLILNIWVQAQIDMIKEWKERPLCLKNDVTSVKAERVLLLKSIGFDENVAHHCVTEWMSMFEQLKAYKIMFGTTNVPLKWNRNLHYWVHRQKSKNWTLSLDTKVIEVERAELLESIGFFHDTESPNFVSKSDLSTTCREDNSVESNMDQQQLLHHNASLNRQKMNQDEQKVNEETQSSQQLNRSTFTEEQNDESNTLLFCSDHTKGTGQQ